MATKKRKKMFRSAADIIPGDLKHLAILKSTARNVGQDDLARGDNARQIFRDLCFRFLDGLESMDEDAIEESMLDEVNLIASDFTDEDVAKENARVSTGRGR